MSDQERLGLSVASGHEAYANYTDAGYHGACHDCDWQGPLHMLGQEGKNLARHDAAKHEASRDRVHTTPRQLSERFYRQATSLSEASTKATATNALLLAILWELRHQSDVLGRRS